MTRYWQRGPRLNQFLHCTLNTSPVPRGMYNLGASCFMNVILQSFVQNPLLRNYFLSDRHHAALCPARENCLACELDKLFTEVRLACSCPDSIRFGLLKNLIFSFS